MHGVIVNRALNFYFEVISVDGSLDLEIETLWKISYGKMFHLYYSISFQTSTRSFIFISTEDIS